MNPLFFLSLMVVGFFSHALLAHQSVHSGPTGWRVLDWRSDQIEQVVSAIPYIEGHTFTEAVDGKHCLTASNLVFDVKDDYAFDIDELVEISFDIELHQQPIDLLFQYDKNGATTKDVNIGEAWALSAAMYTFRGASARRDGLRVWRQAGCLSATVRYCLLVLTVRVLARF